MERFQRLIPIEKWSIPMALALFAAISTVILVARIGIIKSALSDDPFLAYADVFPGQPGSAAVVRDFVCFQTGLPSPTDVSKECMYQPQTGPFSQLTVAVWDGLIVRLDFSVRENAMTMGDLLLWWGDSKYVSAGEFGLLTWPERRLTARGYFPNRRFTHLSPVSHIAFTL
jgi:hypothetical protein